MPVLRTHEFGVRSRIYCARKRERIQRSQAEGLGHCPFDDRDSRECLAYLRERQKAYKLASINRTFTAISARLSTTKYSHRSLPQYDPPDRIYLSPLDAEMGALGYPDCVSNQYFRDVLHQLLSLPMANSHRPRTDPCVLVRILEVLFLTRGTRPTAVARAGLRMFAVLPL